MKVLTQVCLLLFCTNIIAQDGFHFISNKKKVSIPFKLLNNLIIVPIEVNGIALNFLLDTGVEETIVFSLDEKEELKLYDVQKIKLKGLGTEEAIEGLKSSGNVLRLPGMESRNHDILIVLDQGINFSSTLGIPVNGIIGFQFFKENIVEVNYSKKKIYVYNAAMTDKKRLLRKYDSYNFMLEKSKPYIQIAVTIDKDPFPAKCLIDTGNSNALWLFESQSDLVQVPQKNFEDFLGRGFSGSIFGKRAKISEVAIDKFVFKNPVTAFPDENSIKNIFLVSKRLGSIGGELLKRFNIIFDYKNEMIFLKKNNNYNNPFKYNTTGISVHHSGLQWIQESHRLYTPLDLRKDSDLPADSPNLQYSFKLKPIFEIMNIRKDSPAEKAGLLKGDIVVSINNKSALKLTLQQINELLKAEDGYIALTITRNEKEIKFRFKVAELL